MATPTLLQPLAATTPLAGLFNEWLLALSPIELLTRTGRASFARQYLQILTADLHRYHRILAEVAKVLGQGGPTNSLERHCLGNSSQPSLCVPVPQLLRALGLAALGSSLETSTRAAVVLRYNDGFMRKAIAACPTFASSAATIEQLFQMSRLVGFGLLGRNELTKDELKQLTEAILAAQPVEVNNPAANTR